MFGDGVFGIEGLFWCCSGVILLPMLYAVLLPIAVSLPGVRVFGFMALNALFAYALFGYFFGDAAGIFMAAIIMFFAFVAPQGGIRWATRRMRRGTVRQTWGRLQNTRVFSNVGDFFTDGEMPMPAKRKRGDDNIIEGDYTEN